MTSIAVIGWLAGMLVTDIIAGVPAGAGFGWLKRNSDTITMSDNKTMTIASSLRSILPQRFII